MHAERFHLVMDVFRAASELPHAQRGALLVDRCGADRELRDEVEALLQHADWTAGPLRTGAGMVKVLDDPEPHTQAPAAPKRIDADDALPVLSGQYRIVRVLGEGGMGTVYEAEQLLPRRFVAIKAIRRGLGTRRMLRRFEMEMHILGRLQHPGIAQIYDAGAAEDDGTGDAYFVMELVRGRPLTEHAGALGVRDRLELMARVCDAVQHAHQRGVIHRDLKPGNILVAAAGEADAIGQPKVLDFGVARIADEAAQAGTVDASPGQVVGTLAYMSPEQVTPEKDEVDVRSDVYSLGVVLYLSLAGRHPVDLQGKSIPDALRSVRETLPEPLGAINAECRGEIETIVAKAIEKDKSRRYQSAAALGDDLRRYLAGKPIEARRDSTLYVLRKRVMMHRAAFAAAALALAGVVGFLIYMRVQAVRSRELAQSEREARQEATLALEAASSARARADREAGALRESLYLSRIHLAQAAYAACDSDRMRRALADCPEDQRGWEWRYLSRLSDRSARAVQCFMPGASQMSVAAGRDGGRVYASYLDGDVKVFDAATGAALLQFRHTPGEVIAVLTACPSRAEVAIGDSQGGLTIYPEGAAEPIKTCRIHDTGVRVIQFTRDGSRALTAGSDGVVRVWDVPSWEMRRELQPQAELTCDAEFSPDATMIATCGTLGVVRLWDAGSGALLRTMSGHEGTIHALAFSADGRRLVSAGEDSSVRVWDASDGAPISVSRAHTNKATAVAISADGRLVASGGSDSTVRIIDAASGKEARRLLGHSATITGIAFSPDESTVISSSRDGFVRWWRAPAEPDAPEWSPDTLMAVARSPDGKRIAVAGRKHAASVYDLETGSTVMQAQGPGVAPVPSLVLAYSRDGARIYTCGPDNTVVAWDAQTGAEADRLVGHAGWVQSLAAAHASDRIATGGIDRTVLIWNLGETGPVARLAGHEGSVTCMAWTPDDARIVSGSVDGTIRMWNVQTGACERVVRVGEGRGGQVHCIAMTESGHEVVYGMENGLAEMRDVSTFSTWEIIRTFRGHQGAVLCLDIEPRSSRLATGGFDNTVRLWDLRDGSDLLSLNGHVRMVLGVRFSADGSRLISVAGSTAKFWIADEKSIGDGGLSR